MGIDASYNNSYWNGSDSKHRGICPSGWHIPSSEDWGKLSHYVDGTSGTFAGYFSSTAGKYLKTTRGWNSYNEVSGNGTDQYGFSALPGGGYGRWDDGFYNVGNFGYWWSARELNSDFAYFRFIDYSTDAAGWIISDIGKRNLYSVRCLQDGDEKSSSSVSSSSVPSSSSSVGYTGSYGSVHYEGQTYKTVVIGIQTWMAENLNYAVDGSKCLSNSESNCNIYGRLYNWSTAMGFAPSCNSSVCSSQIQSPHRGICPVGWHIPSREEWNMLSSYVQNNSGCSSCDAKKLKATSGWNSNGNGTDDYGFSALPGGNSYWDVVGYDGLWWSASELEDNRNRAYLRTMYYIRDYARWDDFYKDILHSVRCLQD
jgi:uncharacterized protein (TIGR02145 family)